MKKVLILILCFIIAGTIIVKVQYDKAINNPLKISGEYAYTVGEGNDSFYQVLEDLKNKDLIRNVYFMKFYIKKNNIQAEIHPGKYTLNENLSLINLVDLLGKVNTGMAENEVKVTIKEGKNIEEIAEVLEENGVLSKESFLESCKNYEIPAYIKKDKQRRYALEGFLFPDTYRFQKGSDGKTIIKTMLSRFDEIISAIEKEKNTKIEDLDKIITIAALVEKEVSNPKERNLVSSVVYNRLDKGMQIQIDATVLYALGKHKEKVLYKDLEVDSPYNTYKVSGLPVGPIGSPGKESIEAAINPAKTNYLFYVSNNDGTHFFTHDYNEFLRVKAKTQGL